MSMKGSVEVNVNAMKSCSLQFLVILDEIDSGLDVDALRNVASAVNKILTPENSLLMITHYRRILDLLKPSHVHVMDNGKIARTGDLSMVDAIEADGYEPVSALT
ncbi:ABC transporter I family member 6, chloroplastic [Trifolium repens]|nr:ABC transporter I family member 6, chloroplastic [Trifolium repens]